MSDSNPTVPLHSANIERIGSATLTNGHCITLPGDRRIEVWKIVEKANSLCIRIMRPTDDGKTAKLEFGLTREAAIALTVLLQQKLAEPAQPQEFHQQFEAEFLPESPTP